MNKNLILISGIFIALCISSCYYDVEDELYPNTGNCDTLNITYSQTVAPIISSNCKVCHSASMAQGNVVIDTYAAIKTYADNGKLLGSLNHDSGYEPMPKNQNKLSDCNIKKISIWINQGTPNN
ncbi:MAG TPA: hypothetical protein PKM40_00690 [Bacteroidia bacterium]|nr:hypothetical protein [Bacteroidia bacterium]